MSLRFEDSAMRRRSDSNHSDTAPSRRTRRQSRDISRKQMLNEIPDVVSNVLQNYLHECTTYAEEAVERDKHRVERYLRKERRIRARCMQDRTWYISQHVRQRMRDNDQRDLTHMDPSALALQTIQEHLSHDRSSRVRSSPRNDARSRYGGILMTKSNPVPRYDAWIPVMVNYWVGKQLHIEPYMPFLGDQDNECEAAFEVYEDMAGDAGKDVDISDGELNAAGKFMVPRSEADRDRYYSMVDTRWREASRRAILSVLDEYERLDEALWKLLASSLGIKNIDRVKAVARVAQERRDEMNTRMKKREADKRMDREIAAIHSKVTEDPLPLDDDRCSFSNNVLKHFCFTCHTLPCPQHEGVDVIPILPIEDLETSKREELIAKKSVPPCSGSNCAFANIVDLVSPSTPWSTEEILLLREAVPVFGLDPCSIAVAIGSRTCQEVASKLDDPLEADIAKDELRNARTPRRVGDKDKLLDKDSSKDDSGNKTNKTVVDLHDIESTDQDFAPCEHSGPCTADNCPCVKKGIYCESTCGCNFGRYGEGGATGGIVWVSPSEESVREGRARDCLNRHYGCSCESGNCTDSTCPCWEQYRACNPDWCECDVGILPGRVSMEKRHCRNIPVTTGKHKRTFIGKSDIHGFGLFAGERFDTGDLVGIYSGQLMDTRLADMIGRIYDATNRTYIFNVTESLVIDGGLLGSKAKFCNHTKPGTRENCASRLVRVRGDAYVALFCKRDVEPGEEFLFDYRFTGEVPAWAKDDKTSKSKK